MIGLTAKQFNDILVDINDDNRRDIMKERQERSTRITSRRVIDESYYQDECDRQKKKESRSQKGRHLIRSE